MILKIITLSKEHLPLVDTFSCVENSRLLEQYTSKERRRIIRHSQNMDSFIKTEAYSDQQKGLSSTHLFLDSETNKIAAYLSLCNDSIRLDLSERTALGYSYATIPALKIARLAVATKYQHQGIGKLLVQFAAQAAMIMRKISGIAFLTLDCYEHRLSFYESLGFVKNTIQPIVLPYDTPISMRLEINSYLEEMI